MKHNYFTKYIGVFILAVLIIVVYKTFDSISVVFEYIKSFLTLLVPAFMAFGIAFILFPLCVKFETLFSKTKISFVRKHRRGMAVLCIYVLFLSVVSLFLSLMFPALIQSIKEFINQLPDIIKRVKAVFYYAEPFGIDAKALLNSISVTDILGMFNLDDVNMYISHLAGASMAVFNIFLSLIISVYILMDRTGLKTTAAKVSELIFPENSKQVIIKYINRTLNIMYKYIYCQLEDALIVFVLSFVVLAAMKVRYAPLLALMVGLFNLIPYFGAITACVFASVLTIFTASFTKGVWVAVALIIIQQLDANVIQPRLVKDVLQVKPFWVLCGISVGGGLFGMWGIILTVPFMALVKTVFDDYYDYVKAKKNSAAFKTE